VGRLGGPLGASATWAVSCMVKRGVFGFVAGFKWGFPSCLRGPRGLSPTDRDVVSKLFNALYEAKINYKYICVYHCVAHDSNIFLIILAVGCANNTYSDNYLI
jgi:hypothetical protein